VNALLALGDEHDGVVQRHPQSEGGAQIGTGETLKITVALSEPKR
jgi:hypothetical protein